jgi:thiol-disulfide isomerase/thioredoxin
MLRLARTFLLALGIVGLLLSFTVPLRSQEARKPRGKRAPVKPVAVRVITAEQFPALLKPNVARTLLVNYWATWCDPCREEFPDLVKIDKDYRARGLDTIAISLDDLAELKTEVPRFLRLMKARMPVYLLNVADPEPSIKLVDPTWEGALPATFLYDAKGEIVFKKFGRFNTAELRDAIQKVMSGK